MTSDGNVISVMIIDDHPAILDAVTELLGRDKDFLVICKKNDTSNILDIYMDLKPEVVLLDISMPQKNGFEIAKELLRCDPEAVIIFFTNYSFYVDMIEAKKIGVKALVPKSTYISELREIILNVLEGELYFDLKPNNVNPDEGVSLFKIKELLSKQEYEIFKMIGNGYSSRKIAAAMYVSLRTVDYHRAKILKKLKLQTGSQLLHYAIKHSIILKN